MNSLMIKNSPTLYKPIYWFDKKINLIVILFLFWGVFWLLNGGDKFFNGEFVANVSLWSTKGVLVDQNGDIAYRLHPMETVGLFGVNRDAKMINYFDQIYLPPEVALVSLYGIAVLEIFLGLTFLALLFWCLLPDDVKERQNGLFANRTIHRLAFKGSILLFALFSFGDILFGDRTELWEHGTFIILCLITYNLWYKAEQLFIKQRQEVASIDTQEIPVYSSQVFLNQKDLGLPISEN